MLIRTFLLVASLVVAVPAISQTGHPAKGSWAGFLDPIGGEEERIRLLIDDQNGELSGSLNPGRRGVDASKIELDAPTWTLIIEAEMEEGPIVLTGELENLGSWTNRKYIGTYTRGDEKGTFEITLN